MKTIWISLLILVAGSTLPADTTAPKSNPPPPDGNRFLFVVETSSATARLSYGGRQAVVDMIYTGMFGQMREGDSFAIWNYDEELYRGAYSMQYWKPDDMELASSGGQFLKSCSYEKKAQYGEALKGIAELVQSIKDVNVFVVSDPGAKPPKGALGNGFVNEFSQKARKAAQQKQPVITTIVARNGSVSNWMVSVGGEPIKLPAIAIPQHPKPALVVAKPTPPPAPRVARAPIIMTNTRPQPAPEKPKLGEVLSSTADVEYYPMVITNGNVAAKGPLLPFQGEPVKATTPRGEQTQLKQSSRTASVTQTNDAVAKTAEPAPAKSPAAPAAAPVTSAMPVPAKRELPAPAPVVVAAPAPKVSTAIPAPTTFRPPAPPLATPAESESGIAKAPAIDRSLLPEPPKVMARERVTAAPQVAENSPQPVQPTIAMAVPSTQQPAFSPVAMVVIGVLLVALTAVLTFSVMLFLRRATAPTFITQSLDRG